MAMFDHVKRELAVEDAAEGDPLDSIKTMSEDVKRALDALNSAESAHALAVGGGGK